jgi:hypothetical protein
MEEQKLAEEVAEVERLPVLRERPRTEVVVGEVWAHLVQRWRMEVEGAVVLRRKGGFDQKHCGQLA